MKKNVFFLISVVILMISACSPGGNKADQASINDNLQCSFALDSPVDYDVVYGIGFSGVVYKDGKTTAQTLWVPQVIYEKIISNKDGQTSKIYKGKCLYCVGLSKSFFSIAACFVYFVE